ncbi:bifunctional glutamate N-acetyltransferase/amino-acid acetyltransferase ArgJ, partial [Candidatus Pelagibacter sp.]|nr:bifunctional glutamate N-acetyltransferase/amino-acid acetyltransferase ArgJ [Candidatus Pelagibacter sp.]
MGFNISNFLNSKSKNHKMIDFQDLDHIDGLSISAVCANLYKTSRDDLVMFYFREGANFASVYTKSKIVSENIKWNIDQKAKKIFSLLVNTRNANAFTGDQGYKSMQNIAEITSQELSKKQRQDEDEPKIIKSKNILFGCTGTIGETFPEQKIISKIPDLIKNIKYTQNKFIWMKAALGIMTTDTQPKMAMEECYIGKTLVKIYGIAKGSGMIHPNLATTLGYVFTDANLSNDILKKLLNKNIESTFNAISCDGDTSTNDMVSIFSTAHANHKKIISINDKILKNFDQSLNKILLSLAKRVVADGEGASKFISINVNNAKTDTDAKKIAFSIANSPLVKTAIAGEDPNWGRVIMAIGKSQATLKINSLAILFGKISIVKNGKIDPDYSEAKTAEYM